MMQFPITELLDEQKSYQYLWHTLHPNGLSCPAGHPLPNGQAPHERKRWPVVKYRCRQCVKVFDLFTGTIWCGTHYSCSILVLLLRGFAQAVPTLHLAQELGLDYETVLNYRHEWQDQLLKKKSRSPRRCSDRSGRAVPERGRKRPASSGSRRSPASSRQPTPGPRHVGE